jgi:hypothetical protein
MSFDWSEYLHLAQELAGDGTTSVSLEAKQRSAVSRSYFAAYCTARNYLEEADQVQFPPSSDAQKQVIDTLEGSHQSVQRRAVGQNLRRLKNRRNTADYDDIVPGIAKMTQYSLRLCVSILSSLASLRGSGT